MRWERGITAMKTTAGDLFGAGEMKCLRILGMFTFIFCQEYSYDYSISSVCSFIVDSVDENFYMRFGQTRFSGSCAPHQQITLELRSWRSGRTIWRTEYVQGAESLSLKSCVLLYKAMSLYP